MSNTDIFLSSRGVRGLISASKAQNIEWINFSNLKNYIDEENLTLQQIPALASYFGHLRQNRFIPIQNETFFTCYSNYLYAITKSKYSLMSRVDFYSLQSNYRWMQIRDSQIEIVRLHKLIELLNTSDSKNECETFLYSISGVCV